MAKTEIANGTAIWHAMPSAEALVRLDASMAGLTSTTASKRSAKYGANRLPRAKPIRASALFIGQFRSPLIYLLLVASVIAMAMRDWVDAGFILGVLLLNAVIGTTQEAKAGSSADALHQMIQHIAHVRRDGTLTQISADAIVPGDIVELESGMQVPADIRLVESNVLTVDESLLTGEAAAVGKDSGATVASDAPTGDRSTLAHAGTTITSGRGVGVVVAIGKDTALGAVAGSLSAAPATASPLVLQMKRLSRQIAIGAVVVILMFGLALAWRGAPPQDIFLLAVALAVSAIPEGLPIAVTVALAAASWRMAQRHVIVRSLPAVEGLGACTIIATDKTGTLTLNRLSVEHVLLPDGRNLDAPAWRGIAADDAMTALARSGALGNEATETPDGAVGDAVDVALLAFAREIGIDVGKLREESQLLARQPYEPALKFAAALVRRAGCDVLHAKGAVETILPMCVDVPSGIAAEAIRLAAAGYRVLAVASGSASPDPAHPVKLTLRGLICLSDPVRSEVPAAIAACRDAGIGVRMVTGDHPATALAIARTLGIADREDQVATGAQIAALSGGDLRDRLATARVLARFEPAQKLALVQALQANGHLVAVTGDGVNDAPALKAAHIGVAMGKGGTDVARGVADLVLTDDNFASIVSGIGEGRTTYDNVRRIVIVLVSTGLSEVVMFAAALMLGLPMPLAAVQLLWLNVVTNGMQDVTLGFERGTGDSLKRPPRPPSQPLIDRTALMMIVPPALYMAATAIALFAWQLERGASVEAARNFVLFTTVLFQNAYVLGMRSERTALFRLPLFGNPWLLVGVGSALMLQLVVQYLPIAGSVLGTAPMEGADYLRAIAAAGGLLVVTEITKVFVSRQGKAREVSYAPLIHAELTA
ncbi:cation-translocating P-type ATPase [Sphingomonas sp. AX6]|uniref:cation-translocating P-type ATPase n=1 Tax=Sphingomonas sp. AX6 TaxID=2653171 RepID=UPI0012F40178|nr:HAD-IC family P-type ATPase [Sphingomonas sp. AX6]VXC84923.1 putative cation-transporting ATPase F [Sphingomonas sp. AX6]